MLKRRDLLIASAASLGGIAIGYRQLKQKPGNPLAANLEEGLTALTPYVIIDQTGVTLIAPRAEMGQGIHTTLAALIAEELDIQLDSVKVVHGPASETYSNTVLFKPATPKGLVDGFLNKLRHDAGPPRATQLTGGQTSIQDGFIKMRKAGAAARTVLLQAAAKKLETDVSLLRAENGAIVDGRGARIPYADLAIAARDFDPPQNPPLKPRQQWRILGVSQPRVDMEYKCTGRARYSADMKFPGMLHATVKMNPHRGSRMLGFDASKAETMRGVRAIIPLDNGLIVVATNTWYAMKAADSIRIEWEGAAYPPSTEGHRSSVSAACDRQPFSLPRNDGDVDAALNNAEVLEGEYWVPYLAHATMEPLNATALLQDNRLDIWAGNQFPTRAQALGAELTGLPQDAIHVHTTYMGCGFGRRLEMDFIALAIRAASDLKGIPVNVIWSREEDMTQGIYRPMAMARFRAALAQGRPGALDLRLSSQSLSGSMRLRSGRPADNKYDRTITLGGAEQPYEIANYRVSGHRAPELLPVGWWRSVGESQNCFFHESIIDELAHATGADPLLMRLEMLTHEPSRQVLEAVRDMSGWGSRLPEGHARGVAYVFSSGAATAQVIEIRDSDAGFELVKACIAVDVGVALDPRIIESQLQSALVYGLSAAMWGEITVEDGKVQQSNFHDYRMLRFHQIPEIDIHIVESGNEIFGVGEAATPGAAPALGNALFAATGRRLRELPFGRFVRFA